MRSCKSAYARSFRGDGSLEEKQLRGIHYPELRCMHKMNFLLLVGKNVLLDFTESSHIIQYYLSSTICRVLQNKVKKLFGTHLIKKKINVILILFASVIHHTLIYTYLVGYI